MRLLCPRVRDFLCLGSSTLHCCEALAIVQTKGCITK